MSMILPKLWLARIPKYWDRIIPKNYPESTSEFSVMYSTQEIAKAVEEMEKNVNTEESVLNNEDFVAENTFVSDYLGTYDVSGASGELTLLSPVEVTANNVSVLALHLNAENNEWEKVEDAQIIDGYVWGTLESFSPIAVFLVKRESYIDDSKSNYKGPMFVCNGLATTIFSNEDGKVIARDANGKETEITSDMVIAGGSVDGTDLESTYIYCKGKVPNKIITGSFGLEDKSVSVKNAVVIFDSVESEKGIMGSGYMNKIENLDITVLNSKINYVGTGDSINRATNKDSNTVETCSLAGNSWVKKSNIKVKNSVIEIVYGGGASGLTYTDSANLEVDGGNYKWITAGGSNGASGSCNLTVKNATSENIQSVNRGTINEAKMNVIDSKVNLFCGGNKESDVTGKILNNVSVNINGGEVVLSQGTQEGKLIETAEQALSLIKEVNVIKTTDLTYADNAEEVLGGIIKFI